LHAQVEMLLRQMIELPEYKNGGLLPKEVELANRLGISRNTLRQATNKLEYEGLLTRKKGIGTRVAQNTFTTQLKNWHSFTQEMNEKGISFKNYRLQTQWIKADSKISAFFGIKYETEVLKLNRLRGDDKAPFVYFESIFHPRIGLSKKTDFSIPLYEIIEKEHHIVPSLSKEKIRALAATKFIADQLQIHPGDPVLQRERFVFDPGHRPIEYNIGYYVADKFTYTIDIKR
jgi:GntR family transcriptional regulator